MIKSDKAGIYVDTENLFRLLYDAQFDIPKRDRIVIVPMALRHCEQIAAEFTLSYHMNNIECKADHAEAMVANVQALKMCVRLICEKILQKERVKMQIRECVVRIDDAAEKWLQYAATLRQV